MSDGAGDASGRIDPFAGIDPKLNVYALANGMDLTKGPRHRRLEWFTEGLERGILIEVDGDGAFDVGVVAWRTGSEEVRARAVVGGGLSSTDVMTLLDSAIESANGLGAG